MTTDTATAPSTARAAVQPVPPAQGAIPYLIVKGATDAIAFYQRVFDARLLARLDAPEGVPMHVELQVGPAKFFLTEERPEYGSLGPATLGGSGSMAVIYVPDVDAVVQRAVDAGASVRMPVADQFWGDRSGSIVDPFGHGWFISTHIEDVPPEALPGRMQAMMAQGEFGCSGQG